MKKLLLKQSFISVIFLNLSNCDSRVESLPDIYVRKVYIEPLYDSIKLVPQKDTLHFYLDHLSYNNIKNFNLFKDNNDAFISFYSKGSNEVNIYNLYNQKLVRKVKFEGYFKSWQIDKASVYVKRLDSIYLATPGALYRCDANGLVVESMELSSDKDKHAIFKNYAPPLWINNKMYIGVKPAVDSKSSGPFKKWKTMYELEFGNGGKKLIYSLPEIYRRNVYGYPFLDYSYCLNDKGGVVYSFPADANIYETDLLSYHNSYFAKSLFQTDSILPLSDSLMSLEGVFNEYMRKDSYGPIYFDPKQKRYLRLAKHRRDTKKGTHGNELSKEKSIIIFDKSLKIIGESEKVGDYSFDQIFFSPDGNIYARTNFRDENALHFVRLAYIDANR